LYYSEHKVFNYSNETTLPTGILVYH